MPCMDEGAVAPIVTVLMLVASAGMLAAAFVFASDFQSVRPADVPAVGLLADDAGDRLQVVQGDLGTDWSTLEVRTDRPAVVRLQGSDPVVSAGGSFVPVSATATPVLGGHELQVCSLAGPGQTLVELRDVATGTLLYQHALRLEPCVDVPPVAPGVSV